MNWKKILIVVAVVAVIYFAVKYFQSKQALDKKQVAADVKVPSTPGNTGIVVKPDASIDASSFAPPVAG